MPHSLPAVRRPLIARVADRCGRTVRSLEGRAQPIIGDHLDRGELAARCAASPRYNGYLSLEPGLTYIATGAGGLISCAQSGRSAFAVGGVHGEGRDYEDVVREFVRRAQAARVRRALLFPVASDEVDRLNTLGFRSIQTGAEAVVSTAEFTLAGRAFADLRQMRNRAARRHGVSVVEVHPDAHRAVLLEIWREWLAHRPAQHQMTLLIGSPSLDHPDDRRYFAAFDGDGAMVAFATMTPGFGGAAGGVDVMARRADAPAGTMDLLLSEAILALKADGVARVSLGACPMYSTHRPERAMARHLQLVFTTLYRSQLGNRVFGFQSLPAFKGKFAPSWHPTYLAAWPRMGAWPLYVGCGMWGLFGPPWRDPSH